MIENVSPVSSARQPDPVKRAEPAPKTEEKEPEMISENRDEYIPSEEKEPIGLYGASSDKEGGTATANTDKVDREIKALREKARILTQKLRGADENTAKQLKRELEQVTAELAQKDNDDYRRQNAVFNDVS